MYSSLEYDPDNRRDVRAGPNTRSMSLTEYLEHVRNHSREWYASSMHRTILDMVTTRTFFMIEDDYLPPQDAVTNLLDVLVSVPRCAVASACQTYRCPIVGPIGIAPSEEICWDHEKIIYKKCCRPDLRGVREVQGTAFSCFAAKTDPYREAFAAAERECRLTTYLGHDQVIMNTIVRLGWKVLVNFDVWGDHMQPTKNGIYNFGPNDAVQDSYTWDDKIIGYRYKRER